MISGVVRKWFVYEDDDIEFTVASSAGRDSGSLPRADSGLPGQKSRRFRPVEIQLLHSVPATAT